MNKQSDICPSCRSKETLVFYKSAFEQYQPSVWQCKKCLKEFSKDYIDGYRTMFNILEERLRESK